MDHGDGGRRVGSLADWEVPQRRPKGKPNRPPSRLFEGRTDRQEDGRWKERERERGKEIAESSWMAACRCACASSAMEWGSQRPVALLFLSAARRLHIPFHLPFSPCAASPKEQVSDSLLCALLFAGWRTVRCPRAQRPIRWRPCWRRKRRRVHSTTHTHAHRAARQSSAAIRTAQRAATGALDWTRSHFSVVLC